MGIEYRLRFEHNEPESILRDLERLPSTVPRSGNAAALEFREMAGASGMPDATFQLEPAGAYFCDNGGHGREILGRIVARLVSHCGQVIVEEYEP